MQVLRQAAVRNRPVVVSLAVALLVTACRPEPSPITAPTEAVLLSTDTPSSPTDTPSTPTDTPAPPSPTRPPPTDTPVPPTDTLPPPTDVAVPPTNTPLPPTDTPTPTVAPTLTPTALLAPSLLGAAQARLKEQSHHVESEIHVTLEMQFFNMDMLVAQEAEVQSPDRMQKMVEMELFGTPVKTDVIVTDDTVYVSDPNTGAWTIGPDPIAPFSVGSFTSLDPAALEGLDYIGQEELDGTAVHHINATTSPAALALTSPGAEVGLDGKVRLDYWIRVKDGLLHQSTSEGRLTTTGGFPGTISISCTATFSDYGKPVDIQPPSLQTYEPINELLDSASTDSATYSVRKPAGEDWTTQVDTENDVVRFENRVGPTAEVMVFLNPLLWGHGDLPLPASQIAQDYFGSEYDIMITQGVNEGLYELESVRKSTTTVADKAFYYMEFRQVYDEEVAGLPFNVDGVLYLYFPPDFAQHRRFYGIIFKEYYVRGEPRVDLPAGHNQAVLGSFELK